MSPISTEYAGNAVKCREMPEKNIGTISICLHCRIPTYSGGNRQSHHKILYQLIKIKLLKKKRRM